ncbi:leucine-rich repeat protein [Clostridium sp.]|uniref:leucine-rich repeat protein n=1 Tax=Clostridium sp. TaxID=1506 RepID=UPI0026075EEF|nr:leucine-rich repeat protein [Clostridium sp.]
MQNGSRIKKAGGIQREVPSSVTIIGDEAFDGCKNLSSITIPNNLTIIKAGAFSGCENTMFKVKSEAVKQLLINISFILRMPYHSI